MKALLLSYREDYYSTRRLLEALRARGHEAVRADPGRCDLGPGDGGRALRIGGTPASGFDFCLPRLSRARLDHTFRVVEALEDSGTLSLNPSASLRQARDKFEVFRVLRAAGLPTPETTLAADPDGASAAAESVGGFPVVMKPLRGTQGTGVSLVRDADTARALLRHYQSRGETAVFQAYVPEAREGDIRLITVGARVLGAIRRKGAEGDFRSNLHQGGSASPWGPSDALRDLASRAAAAFALRFAGVDVILTGREPMVIEVNASPGFGGFETATGVDVAAPVAELAERLLGDRLPWQDSFFPRPGPAPADETE
jgi:ribosomal protein S6--L-glutamate ligase